MKIINFKNNSQIINKKQVLHENTKNCYICIERLEDKYVKDKKCSKAWDHYHYKGE